MNKYQKAGIIFLIIGAVMAIAGAVQWDPVKTIDNALVYGGAACGVLGALLLIFGKAFADVFQLTNGA